MSDLNGSEKNGYKNRDDGEEKKDGDAEDDNDGEDDEDEPVFLNVMADTVEEMRKIGQNRVQLQIYVVKILRHVWNNVFNINLGRLFSEIQEELFLDVRFENRADLLLPLLIAYLTRYEHHDHERTSKDFHTFFDDIERVIRMTKFNDESYKWILKLLKELGDHIHILAADVAVIRRRDIASVLRLRLVKLLDAVLIHKSEACSGLMNILSDILRAEKKEGKSVSLLHAAVIALPKCKSDIVKLLLRLGASANHLDEFDTTPMHHLAARCGLDDMEVFEVSREKILEVLNLLLQYGAHVDYCDTEGKSALSMFHNNMFDISAVKHQSLQCLAAQEVNRIPIVHQVEIPQHLREFVTRHNPTFRKHVRKSFGDYFTYLKIFGSDSEAYSDDDDDDEFAYSDDDDDDDDDNDDDDDDDDYFAENVCVVS